MNWNQLVKRLFMSTSVKWRKPTVCYLLKVNGDQLLVLIQEYMSSTVYKETSLSSLVKEFKNKQAIEEKWLVQNITNSILNGDSNSVYDVSFS
ncbi:hypothetical protein CDAR_435351 [Caerostris darwini]|uniref:Uncharacterized protein n=1 Tax=Caerostris darwini TaxID=1538125 RepID=A0AAV4SGN2_9ARAC|nr:hypothetical protein CDAR_435351 [Caerostris darwini]